MRINKHSKQLYHQVYTCNRHLPQLNDLSMINLGTSATTTMYPIHKFESMWPAPFTAQWFIKDQLRNKGEFCYYNNVANHFLFLFFSIFKSPYFFWIECGSKQYPIRRFQQLLKVQITFELNEKTVFHPFISSSFYHYGYDKQ